MAKTTIPEDGTRGALVIYYNDVRSINYFLKTPLVADETGARERRQKSIPGYQRRKGPSDLNPTNVTQSTADYMFDPTLKSGNALPGRSFIFQTTSNADVDATRRFTFVGRAVDFLEYFEDDMSYETYVYFSDGARHTLGATVEVPEA